MPGLLEEGIRAAILTETSDWWASCPATVTHVSQDGQTITAQPLIKRVYPAAQESTTRPPIANVPVVLPAAGVGALELQLAVGDTVLLVCSSRSVDEVREADWSQGAPRDTRRFSLSDAFAIPFRTASPATSTLRLVDGKVRLGSAAVDVIATIREAFYLIGVNLIADPGLAASAATDAANELATLEET